MPNSGIAILVAVAIAVVIALVVLLKRKKPADKAELPSAERKFTGEERKDSRPAAPGVTPIDENAIDPKKSQTETAPEEVSEPTASAAVRDDSGAPHLSEPAIGAPSSLAPAAVPAEDKKEVISIAPGFVLDERLEKDAETELQEAKRERKLQKLRQGLSQTRGGFIAKIGGLFKEKKTIDPALLDQLEEALITADVGAKTTEWFTSLLREALDKKELSEPEAVWALLKREVRHVLSIQAPIPEIRAGRPHTIMVVGVNGVGKTTTIGKLASKYTEQGYKVVLAAGDTFRAAAVNQLEIWGRRTKCEVVKSKEGADPSSVVFDAVKRAKEISADIVIADTAGRLHTQVTLMEELKKVARVMGKAHEGAPHEVLLVLDATTGQNAIHQVREFGGSLGITGLVLTKLDGTAKGGVTIGVCHEHKIPVRYVGIGEAKEDLRDFEVDEFVDALFLREEEGAQVKG